MARPGPHPLHQLSPQELETVVTIVKSYHSGKSIHFKFVGNEEPPKAMMTAYLEAEHAGATPASLPRVAYAYYYVMEERRVSEIWVDVSAKKIIKYTQLGARVHPPIDFSEAEPALEASMKHGLVKEAMDKLGLDPSKHKIDGDGWMYGCDTEETMPRLLMILMYCRSPENNHPDSNIYAFPIPFVPVYDVFEKKIVRVDWCATGSDADDAKGFNYNTRTEGKTVLDNNATNEYIPELQPSLRTDLKPYNVVQPEGPSFSVDDDNLVSWQKWKFRVGFNPREGLVLHDVTYDGRSTFYRLSVSEMTVPYGDPRPPLHRKMAFDFGDCGAGKCANELNLGCDCLGTIKYFDGNVVLPDGSVHVKKNVICMHEQDDGLLWKHTNYRTNVAAVARRRILILQMILTVGNYEYIFAWHLDQAAGISLEVRATGIVSTQAIDAGKRSQWGNIVSPGALAASHQHIFSMRIDPAIDGHKNSAVINETVSVPWDEKNPYGTGFKAVSKYVEKSTALDADIQSNRVIKMVNENKLNPVSGNPVGYKLLGVPTAMLYAQPGSVARKRAAFATHHYWITRFKDNEFYAGGVWTNQSSREIDGVKDAVDRNEDVRNEDFVLWHSFGLTHHPRVEDFPVMPTEMLKIQLVPADFFDKSPAIDVPPSTQAFNRSVDVMAKRSCHL
uniref:Amine oxidase n=1 Tax=Blastobotrys adeninivorans TaxID=409370 RepID=A0A060T8X0_BLAAD